MIYFGFAFVELLSFCTSICRILPILNWHLSSFTHFVFTFVELDQFWTYTCRARLILDLHLSIFALFGITFVELDTFSTYTCRTWPILNIQVVQGQRPLSICWGPRGQRLPSTNPPVLLCKHRSEQYITFLQETATSQSAFEALNFRWSYFRLQGISNDQHLRKYNSVRNSDFLHFKQNTSLYGF